MASDYNDAIKDTITAYKFDYKRSASRDLAFYMHNALPYFDDVVVSYVPTASAHIRMRGFNHSKLLAMEFAKLRQLPCIATLRRTGNISQKGSSRDVRKKQLQGCIAPLSAYSTGKKILLIDDVITTGATIEECTRVLYKAGATQVAVAVVARTPLS